MSCCEFGVLRRWIEGEVNEVCWWFAARSSVEGGEQWARSSGACECLAGRSILGSVAGGRFEKRLR